MDDTLDLENFASQCYSSSLTFGKFLSMSQQNGGPHIQGRGDSYQAVYGGRLLAAFNHTEVWYGEGQHERRVLPEIGPASSENGEFVLPVQGVNCLSGSHGP
jgi:hypothetical protein